VGEGVMTKYVQMEIRTLQAVKMGSTGSQSDYELALDYIAGSTLRGAFIGEYLKQHPNLELHQHTVERKRWLEGGIRFLNAYPAFGNRRSYPLPTCLYADKGEMKLLKQKGKLNQPANILDDVAGTAGKVRIKGGFLAEDQDGCWRWLETETQGKLHINLRGERTNLYRYESIAPGQTFITAVAMDEEDGDLLNFFLSFKGRKLHLGGSRSNGYGLCEITDVREASRNPEIPESAFEWGEYLYLYCLSDVIIRDEEGQLCSIVPESYLENRLGVKVSLEGSAVQMITTSGFNQRWGAKWPQLQAIRKGSVLKYRLHDKHDPEKLSALQDKGIGERLADGYGRILLLPRLDIRQLVVSEQDGRNEPEKAPSSRSETDQAMLKNMYKRIMLQRIRKQREYYLLKLDRATDDKRISSAQLANWMELLGHAMNVSPTQGKREIFEYIEHLKTRESRDSTGATEKQERLIQKTYDSLNSSKIDGVRWLEFMKKAVEEADDLEALSNRLELKWLDLPGLDKSEIFSREETYRLTLSMLREYIRLRRLMKSRKGKGARRA